ncbi:MarR family transcriptional regulator [Alicyclobacillus acidiphilus]|uniref:MarR family transcriptional regulator n=1 Tax=Alicyclobacillus acidiphilus TaxID=182455 RepID=UPI00083721D2|nr:MarR family transcriptional regulator [Alicyclobacillus acidiphilus]
MERFQSNDPVERNDGHEVKTLMNEIIRLIVQLQQRIEFDEEKQWLRAHCENPVLQQMVDNMTTMTLHVLDTIGRCQPVNGITISKEMQVPKGTVSKITRRLMKSELIIAGSIPENRKEIYFRLTPLGHELFGLHRMLHERIDEGVQRFFQKYDVNELRFIVSFLRDGLASPWIAPEPDEVD